MQGYLFGRPMTKDEISARLAAERRPLEQAVS